MEKFSSSRFLEVTLSANLKFTEHAAAVNKKGTPMTSLPQMTKKKARMSTTVLTFL